MSAEQITSCQELITGAKRIVVEGENLNTGVVRRLSLFAQLAGFGLYQTEAGFEMRGENELAEENTGPFALVLDAMKLQNPEMQITAF